MTNAATRRGPREIIARRWLRVLSIAFTVFALSLVVVWIERSKLDDLGKLPGWLLIAGVATLLALIFYWRPRRFFAALGLRHALLHPPYWFGVSIGIGIALAVVDNIQIVNSDFILTTSAEHALDSGAFYLLAVPIAVLFASALFTPLARLKQRHHWHDQSPIKRLGGGQRQQKLSLWYHDDTAITSAENDLFDLEIIAQRMARRLIDEPVSAQTLLGRLGTGKTTVRLFVEEYLRNHYPKAPLTFVAIELWPYETPRAAVEGILRSITERLAEHVTTSQLNGLPTAYAEAIAAASGLATWIPNVRKQAASPYELLEELDNIAAVIGQRIVLWIEDLERFAFGNPGAKFAEASEWERLTPIRALLYGLDRLKSFTIVTATTDLFQRFDLEKIARYVERIPEIPYQLARRIISRARKQWMDEVTYIDPVPKLARAKLGWDDNDEALPFGIIVNSINSLGVAVSTLAVSPRTLKQGLRRCNEGWRRLRGEVDLDDLLAMCVLREAAPDVFAIVERNIQDLRGRVLRSRREDRNPIAEVEKEVVELGLEDRQRQAVAYIIQNVFDKRSWRPQGFRSSNHADYWQRFLTLPDLSESEQDQAALRTMIDSDDAAVVKLLSDPARSSTVEDFSLILPPKRLQRLLLTLVAARLHENPSTWDEGRTPPGLIPYWRMLRERSDALDIDVLVEDVLKSLELAAPTNIALLEEVVHWIATSSPELADLLPPREHIRIKQRSRELLRDVYTGKAQLLAERLRDTFPFTLFWLCWGLERIRSGRARGVPFEGWQPFANTLIEALKIDPTTVAAQIAPFVVKENRRIHGPDEWEFDREQCTMLFGDPDEFVTTVKDAVDGKTVDGRVNAILRPHALPADPEESGDPDEPAIGYESEPGMPMATDAENPAVE